MNADPSPQTLRNFLAIRVGEGTDDKGIPCRHCSGARWSERTLVGLGQEDIVLRCVHTHCATIGNQSDSGIFLLPQVKGSDDLRGPLNEQDPDEWPERPATTHDEVAEEARSARKKAS